MKTIVLWAFLLGTVRCGDYSEMPKSPADPANIKFTIKSSCNQTGHWQAKVQLEPTDVEEDVTVSDVDIDQTLTPRCNRFGSVLVVANITVPPQGNAVVTAQPQKNVPKGYTKFSEGHYFKTHEEFLKFLPASEACQQEGAYLAVIDSEAEARFITAMWTFGHGWAYVGIHDIYEEGHYVTTNNETLRDTAYQKWNPGEPNGGSGENCGQIQRNLLLYDVGCQNTAPFFCELEY